MRNRTRLLVFAATATVALVVLALPVLAAGKQETGPVVLRTVVFKGFARTAALELQIPEYEKLTGVKVEFEEVPFAQLHEKMILDFASQAGTYDFVISLTDWVTELVRGEYLVALDDYIKKDPPEDWPNAFPKGLLSIQTVNNKLYGLPCHDGPIMLYYRKDLFQDPQEKSAFKAKYGYDLQPPETWDHFLDMTRFFTRPADNLWGTCIAAKQGGQQLAYDFFLMLWSFGGEIFDANYKPTFNSDAGVKGLQYYIDLRNKWEVTPKASTTYDETENGPVYLNGNAALMWHWSHIASWAELPDRSKIMGNNGYTLFPVARKGLPHTTLSIYWFFGISSASKNKDATYELINWLTNKENDKLDAFNGTVACRLSTYRDPDVLAKFPFYANIEKLLSGETRTTPQIPEYAQVDDIIGVACSKAIAGEMSAKAALDDAAAKVEDLMRKAGYYK
ncbi:MAG: sugar ABC transporter substrate-binding protein [Spirochaetales bacterium]|nr:sugar ABC transporter substrate-binding protein [Spirochaetales bacterium]